MEKNKRTQGIFFVDAGDTISELLLRVETKEDVNTELFDICDFSADETNNVKANAEFICEAVNNYDKLKEDNAFLLKNIERLKVCAKKVLQYPKGSQGYDPIDAINLEDAIKKAQ